MIAPSVKSLGADAGLPPLGPFSVSRDEHARSGDLVILSLVVIGLSVAALVVIAAGLGGAS